MTMKKSTKRALLLSALALLMCVTMLIGSTFAWFTDSVTSGGNIIKSGTLDVTMEWADGTKAVPADDSTDWTDASTGAIFDYDLWEPGYTEVRHIKIANEGTLALKYQLSIIANGEVSKLADVIDVYYVDPAVQVADRTQLTDANKLGTLTEILANVSTSASGKLLAGEKHTVTLALKMQEEAGNDYQNLAIGTDFTVKLFATQYTYEEDSFDDQYDAEAQLPTYVTTEAELRAVAEVGGWAIFGNDISVSDTINMNGGIIDGDGKTLTFTNTATGAVLINPTGGTIKNLKFANSNTSWVGSQYAIGSIQFASTTLTEDLYIENVTISNFDMAIDLDAKGNSVYVKDSEIANFVQVAYGKLLTFEGCHLMADNATKTSNANPQAILFLMGDMTFKKCHFEENVNFYLDSTRYSGTVTFENSTYGNNGVENRPIESFGFITYWFPPFGIYGYAGTFGETKPAQTNFNWIVDGTVVWTATGL